MTSYELKIDQFEGPLDKLLELIEARKLEPTTISLAAVTDDFLKHLGTLRAAYDARGASEGGRTSAAVAAHLRLIADFIVIASRLVFVKSKALLPDIALSDEEEADIADLTVRLRTLKEFRPAMKLLAELWVAPRQSASRPYLLNTISPSDRTGGVTVFYPSPSLSVEALSGALKNLFVIFEKFALENETIQGRTVSLEEKIHEILARIREIVSTSFSRLTNASTRGEMVIAFLAILHLAREQMILLEQESHLSDIIIKRQEVA